MSAYMIKVTLEHTSPPVWRRIIIPNQINFYDLHQIIQISFGWENFHLHDFSFPETKLRIIPQNDSCFGDYGYETDILVDEYLTTYSYIRYTYDFGDNWNHKIVLEQECPDYGERYATIIKSKGDNFEEDCGGVFWATADDRIPFSEVATNSKLVAYNIPIRATKDTTILSPKVEKSLTAFSKLLKKYYKHSQKSSCNDVKPLSSKFCKNISNMKSFLEELHKSNIDFHSLKQTNYRQMTLFSLEDNSNSFSLGSHQFPYEIYKESTDISSKNALLSLNLIEAGDYCHYLQLDASTAKNVSEHVQIILDFLNANPKYYLWIFTKNEWDKLETLYHHDDCMLLDIPDETVLIKGMYLGLLNCQITKEKSYHRMSICFSTEAGSIFQSLPAKMRTKEYRFLYANLKIIQTLLQAYSMIDLPSFYEKYIQFGGKCDAIEFNRLIYWYGRFDESIITVTHNDTNITYVATPYVNVSDCISTIIDNPSLSGLPYADLDFHTYQDFQKGIIDAYDCFEDYVIFLKYSLQYSPNDSIDMVNKVYQMIVNNGTVYDIFNLHLSRSDILTIANYRTLWLHIMDLFMTIQIPHLKGHCRLEILNTFFSLPSTVFVCCNNGLPFNKITKDTHLYEMDSSIQLEAYRLMYDTDPSEAAKKLNQLLKKCGNDNEEIKYLIVDQYIYSSQFIKAKTMLNNIQNGRSMNDPEIESFIKDIDELMTLDDDDYDNDDFSNYPYYTYQEPYVRQTPKVGRNDPCPCGSGLKYKKCCGK